MLLVYLITTQLAIAVVAMQILEMHSIRFGQWKIV